MNMAGLDPVSHAAMDSNFDANWSTCQLWSEQKRYHVISEAEARDLVDAIEDVSHGVLPWIKTHY